MTRFVTVLLLLTLSGLDALCQDAQSEKVSRLEEQLAKASEQEQIPLLNELAELQRRRFPDKALELTTRSLELATKYEDLRGQAFAQKVTAMALMVLERDSEALSHMEQAEHLFVRLGDKEQIAKSSGNRAILLSHTGKPWQAIEATQRALAIFEELDDRPGMAAANNNLCVNYGKVGDYQQALQFGLESLRIEESLGRQIGMANNLNSIGNIYSQMGDHLKGREYYQRALTIFTEIDEQGGAAHCLNNIGITFEKLEDDDEALNYLERSLAIARELESPTLTANALANIGIVYKKRKQYDDALATYLEVAEILRQLEDQHRLAGTYKNIAEVHQLRQHYPEALDYLDKALAIGKELNSNAILGGVYQGLAELHAARGDFKKALELQILFSQTRDAMLNEQIATTVAELQEKYEADRRRTEIEQLTQDNELLQKDAEIRDLELSRTRLIGLALVLLTVVVVGVAALLFRRYLYLLAFWKRRSFIGHYRVEEEITRGGMGVIYRATSVVDPSKRVALKVIRDELAMDEKQRQRFINEGKVIDALDHPNVVKVYERGEHNQRLYIAMEYLEGRTLAEVIQESTQRGDMIPVKRCLSVMKELTDAVATIHVKGIVHRDIKPTNVIVTSNDGVKLLDFGIAKVDTMTTLTEAGEILGTINYMAPEQVQHREPTGASDVFSLGALFYELLTLERPFLGEDPADVLKQVLTKEPLEPRHYRPELGNGISDLIMAMLRKEPATRPRDEDVLHQVTRLATAGAIS